MNDRELTQQAMETLRARLAQPEQEPVNPLKEAVYEFFTKYLNRVEYSDSDRPFNPITIGCCRVMMLQPLGDLLDKMRELSGAGPNPLEKLRNEN